jgi:hypothetical protein
MADCLSFTTQFQREPSEPEVNPGTYFVFSVAEASSLKADFMTAAHLSAYGEPSTFCLVRYGQQEYRTDVCRETLNPKWGAGFFFEADPLAEEVLFLFFSEDPSTQLSDLFGHVVIPLKPADVPLNTVYMKEEVTIVKCDHRALHLLRDAGANEQTWPTVSPVIAGTFKGDLSVGKAKLAVTMLQVTDLPALIKGGGGGENMDAKRVLDATQASVQAMLKGLASVSPKGSAAVKKAEKVVADRRKNPAAPQELSALAAEAVQELVKAVAATNAEKDELASKTKGLDSKLKKNEVEKNKSAAGLSATVDELKTKLSGESTARKAAEAEAVAAAATVAALTASVAALEAANAVATSSTTAALAGSAKLEETNKYLLRKGLELAGTGAAVGFGFGMFGGAAAGGGDLMSKMKSGDAGSEYSATGLALRRCAAGASALVEYESGQSAFEAADLATVLMENLVGSMAYLKGEVVACDQKELAKLSEQLAAVTAKVAADPGVVLAAFYKQLAVFQTVAQRLVFGSKSKEAFPARARWPLDDAMVKALTAVDAKELLKAARGLALMWDNLSAKAMGDVMYDPTVVSNLEWVVKMSAQASELLMVAGARDPLQFVRVHGVLTFEEAEELRYKFQAMADTAGEASLAKPTLRKLVGLVCRDAGEKAPKDADLDAAFDNADAAGAGAVDEDEFLSIYAACRKGEVKGLADAATATGESL